MEKINENSVSAYFLNIIVELGVGAYLLEVGLGADCETGSRCDLHLSSPLDKNDKWTELYRAAVSYCGNIPGLIALATLPAGTNTHDGITCGRTLAGQFISEGKKKKGFVR